MCSLYEVELLDKVRHLSPLIDHEEYIANIYANGTLEVGFELDVPTHGFPVTIESKTNQLAIAIEDGATGVTTGNVII